jgi:peptidoglycan/xylan/chitin deacetylase (PgdA/CDA1 family)
MDFWQTSTASAAALAALAGAAAYATLNSQSQWFGPVLVAPPRPNQLALTFDDGPNPVATPRLLEVLARHNARATFFLIGEHVQREPVLTREILAAGHVIGNHTQTHPWLPRHSNAFIRSEIRGGHETLQQTLGEAVTLFRPPHGARRPAVLRAARELGMQTVLWNLILGDWHPIPAETIHDRLERGIARSRARGVGTNFVLHDGGQHSSGAPRLPTVAAVDLLLTNLGNSMNFVVPPLWSAAESRS